MIEVPTKKEFKEMLDELKAAEQIAKAGFEQDLNNYEELEIKMTLQKIKEEKTEHIKMLEEAIGLCD